MMEIKFGDYLPEKFYGERLGDQPATKVAVIGTGQWAREHSRAFHANPFCELVGIRGRNQARVEARAAEYGTRAYLDIHEMLESERPDFVSICVENAVHFETAMQIIKADLPLLVEKPLTVDLDESKRLVEAAESRNLFFAINFNHRYSEPFLRTKQLVESGEVGDIVFSSWRFGGNHDYKFDHPHIQLIETDCHGIDMLLHQVGNIESVSAEMTDKSGKDGFGTVMLVFQFTGGSIGSILASYDTSYAYPSVNTFEIVGTRGRVWIEDTVKKMTFNRIDDPVAQVWQSTFFDDEARSFAGTTDRHFADLIRAFRNDETPPIPARRGLEVLKICYAAIRSFEQGRRVRIDEIE